MPVGSDRLALGTVQFGLDYGVANRGGQIAREDAAAILGYARSAGLDTLDTAIAYGSSEQRLGEIGVDGWRVVSKIPGIPDGCADVAGWVERSVRESLARLRVGRLYGLLLHKPQDLLGASGPALYDALVAVKRQGLVSKLGISIYGPEELDAMWSRFRLDLVQAPFNVIDRRIETSGWMAKLRAGGAELHVRSAFLQGLLLMPDLERPESFAKWNGVWRAWSGWLRETGLTALRASLGFVGRRAAIDRVVVGVDNLAHLREIVDAAGTDAPEPPATLASEDQQLINPARWEKP